MTRPFAVEANVLTEERRPEDICAVQTIHQSVDDQCCRSSDVSDGETAAKERGRFQQWSSW